VDDVWNILGQFFATFWTLLVLSAQLILLVLSKYLLVLVGLVWCLWGINWRKAWPVLAQGAWLPLAFLAFTVALVWSQIAPSQGNFLGLVNVPNFWWQLGNVLLFLALFLLCGCVQTMYGWAPAEIDLEPPAQSEHGHGHH
jgi:hypothetical protein